MTIDKNSLEDLKILFPDPSSFKPDSWDIADAESLIRRFDDLQKNRTLSQKQLHCDLISDGYFALTNVEINYNDPLGLVWDRVKHTEQFCKLQDNAGNDPVRQALTVNHLAKQFLDVFQEIKTKAEEKVEDQQKQEQPQDQGESDEQPTPPGDEQTGDDIEMIEVAPGDDQDEPGDQDASDEIQDALAQAAKEIFAQDVMAMTHLDQAINDLEDTAEDVEATAKMVECFGASLDPGLSPKERSKQAMQIAQDFPAKEFAKMLGWAENILDGIVYRPVKSDSGELERYAPDAWGDNTAPEDMAAVADGQDQALVDLADEQLTTAKHRSEELSGPGPVILMVDNSSSMRWSSSGDGIERFDRARMVEMALAYVFRKKHRDLVTIDWCAATVGHGRNPDYLTGYEALVKTYVHGEPGLETHIRSMMGGGTNFVCALEKTVEIADEFGDNVDILVLTDGDFGGRREDNIKQSKAILKEFRENGGRLWGLGFGEANSVTFETMKKIMDGALVEKDLSDSPEFAKMIREMAQSRADDFGPKKVH